MFLILFSFYSLGQTCKIPDQNLYEFEMVGKGAWCLRFSANGKSLAVACPYPALLGSASIRIYSVETGQMEVELPGNTQAKRPFINYVRQFFGFLSPPPPLCKGP